jgi:hypothetical protein
MRFMRLVPPLALALACLPLLADDEEVPEAAIAVFESASASWAGESAKGVASHFDKEEKVSINTGGGSKSYSKDQATEVLADYFDKISVISLELEEDGYKGGDRPSATYIYEYEDGNGKKREGSLFVTLVKKGNRWIISRISVGS